MINSDLTTTKPAAQTTLISGEALFERGDLGRVELIQGEIVELALPGFVQGVITGNVSYILNRARQKMKAGVFMMGKIGIYTRCNPDTVRGLMWPTFRTNALARPNQKATSMSLPN